MLNLYDTPNFDNSKPAEFKAIFKDNLYYFKLAVLGRIMMRFKIPDFIKPMEIYDRLTNSYLKVKTVKYYTIIYINGKDLYFQRLAGKYDGSGMMTIKEKLN